MTSHSRIQASKQPAGRTSGFQEKRLALHPHRRPMKRERIGQEAKVKRKENESNNAASTRRFALAAREKPGRSALSGNRFVDAVRFCKQASCMASEGGRKNYVSPLERYERKNISSIRPCVRPPFVFAQTSPKHTYISRWPI